MLLKTFAAVDLTAATSSPHVPPHTVDGRNPAPPGMYKTLQIMGTTTNLNWLARFLNHHQYHKKNRPLKPETEPPFHTGRASVTEGGPEKFSVRRHSTATVSQSLRAHAWRIIPVSKWLVNPIISLKKAWSSAICKGSHNPILRGLINHRPLVLTSYKSWDDWRFGARVGGLDSDWVEKDWES